MSIYLGTFEAELVFYRWHQTNLRGHQPMWQPQRFKRSLSGVGPTPPDKQQLERVGISVTHISMAGSMRSACGIKSRTKQWCRLSPLYTPRKTVSSCLFRWQHPNIKTVCNRCSSTCWRRLVLVQGTNSACAINLKHFFVPTSHSLL